VLDKIKRGEFVNFDSLLNQNSGRNLSFTIDESSDTPRVVCQQKASATRQQVSDYCSWFLAWSLFVTATILYRGHLVEQLLKYQLFVAQMSQQYNFQAWYPYDKAFHTFTANNPLAR